MPYVSKGEFFFYFDQTYFIIIHLITESDVLLEYHWGLIAGSIWLFQSLGFSPNVLMG